MHSKRAYRSTPWTSIPELLLSPSKRRRSVSGEEDNESAGDLDYIAANELDGEHQKQGANPKDLGGECVS